ncbi:alpha/beta hydrolase [Falsirhodobacter sp. alg1]|uniref:alpha/beta hydrolase n=1 Tax=Falsirhodobacter sp. alg1 TaxID=1472418 RepID=UPI00078799A1|nr:alpha/beta hydrolase [Falsirhodobacter sp. alg1]
MQGQPPRSAPFGAARYNTPTPITVVFLHALGGSARSFDAVAGLLHPALTPLALNLPGFGDNVLQGAPSLDRTLAHIADNVPKDGPWIMVGHSMGAKFASMLAARNPAGLCGICLVAGSPPSPEPIDEARRASMTDWAADGPLSYANAAEFIAGNTASPLPTQAHEALAHDLQRTDPAAWTHWLQTGAKQDVRDKVGEISLPAIILAGAEDGDLGAANQRLLNLPHYTDGTVQEIDGAAHLIPAERPAALAAGIHALWHIIRLDHATDIDPLTKAVLRKRLQGPHPVSLLEDADRKILRAITARLVPAEDVINLPLRVEAAVATGGGDGWRFADLPPDTDALRQGLQAVRADRPDFPDLPPAEQDAYLRRIQKGPLSRWFEDLRANTVKEWVSHPVTLQRLGYDGLTDPRTLPQKEVRI